MDAAAHAHVERLDARMPALYWFRDHHAFRRGRLEILGYAALGPGSRREDIVFELGGARVEPRLAGTRRWWRWGRSSSLTDVHERFWFVPEPRRLTFTIAVSMPDPAGPVPLTVCLRDVPAERRMESTLWHFADLTDLGPTPPVEKIQRVSGKAARPYNYFNNGISDFHRFVSVARRHGLDPDAGHVRVLDWGCGCGRLTRHLLALAGAGRRVVGVDIDHDAIEWCKRNLLDSAFDRVELYPPTKFSDHAFDLVLANSVLSHLQLPAMRSWLREVHRMLRPGGLALLSYHGDFGAACTFSTNAAFYQTIMESGFNADLRASELDAVIDDHAYYRQTFMTDEFARGLFAEHFKVEEQVVGIVSRYQNVAVLRKA